MSKEEDLDLIQAFLGGDQSAFDKIVLKHKNMVFNLCFRLLNDFEEAEDCAQEIFIKVYKNIGKFRFQSAFSTWLYRVAVNTCKNKLGSLDFRIKNKTKEWDGAVESDNNQNSAAAPEKNIEIKEINRHIEAAIDTLSADHKILVVLRDIELRSYEEIANATGMKLGTVKSKLSRAREQLKKKLKEVIQ